MRLQRDSYAPKSCAFDAANVQFLRAHLCKSHPVLQHKQKYLSAVANIKKQNFEILVSGSLVDKATGAITTVDPMTV